jgi:hypothetical protein
VQQVPKQRQGGDRHYPRLALNGYYRSEDDPPVIDTDKFVEDAKKLGKYCSENPTVGLITAMDELFAK